MAFSSIPYFCYFKLYNEKKMQKSVLFNFIIFKKWNDLFIVTNRFSGLTLKLKEETEWGALKWFHNLSWCSPHPTFITAGEQIFSGYLQRDFTSALDTQPVRNGFSRPKGLREITTSVSVLFLAGWCFCRISSRLTQQDPQFPWSLICWIVGQLGHCCRESKLSGSFRPSTSWTLKKRQLMIDR